MDTLLILDGLTEAVWFFLWLTIVLLLLDFAIWGRGTPNGKGGHNYKTPNWYSAVSSYVLVLFVVMLFTWVIMWALIGMQLV